MDIGYGLRVAGILLRHPREAATRIRQRQDRRRYSDDRHVDYRPVDEWEAELHARLGVATPCADSARFDEVFDELRRSLPRFPYEHDADPALARALWCITRHTRPAQAVETGVARGVSSRFILEGLAQNGAGHLWSVDLPPLLPGFHASVGAAVTEALRPRWTYIRAPSHRELPRLFARIAPIDLFVQDSVGTPPTVRAELELAWRALEPHGWLVINAINRSEAFGDFVDTHAPEWHVVGRAGHKASLEEEGEVIGQFAVVRKGKPG